MSILDVQSWESYSWNEQNGEEIFSYNLFLFFSQSELSFLRNQLEESKLQQQELTDSIDEKVRCW